MNRKLLTVLVFISLAFGALTSAYADDELGRCNDQLIAGSYGFTIVGEKLVGPPFTGAQVGVAMAHFDGNGNFHQIDSVTIGGNAASNFSHTPASGTYHVNPDCTGSFTLTFTDGRPTVTADFVVVENGAEIDTVVTSAGGAQGILATRSIGKRRSWWE